MCPDRECSPARPNNITAKRSRRMLSDRRSKRLSSSHAEIYTLSLHDALPISFVVMLASILVDVSRSRMLSRAAKQYHSQALETDALHFSTDIWSSAVVI